MKSPTVLQYNTISGRPIRLEIFKKSSDVLTVNIHNNLYFKERWKCLRHLSILFAIYLTYRIHFQTDLRIDFTLLTCIIIIFIRLRGLIKFESLRYFEGFALQLTTGFFLNRKANIFIPSENVHDVVINEVICDLKVIYVLIVRCKGDFKPIIPAFNALKPSIDCLQPIYKEIRQISVGGTN